MKRIISSVFLAMFVLTLIPGCEKNQSLKEDVKDVGQDIKNEFNKATD